MLQNCIQMLMLSWSLLERWKEMVPDLRNYSSDWFVALGHRLQWNLCNHHCEYSFVRFHWIVQLCVYTQCVFMSLNTILNIPIFTATQRHRLLHQSFSYWTKRPNWFQHHMHWCTLALSFSWFTSNCRRFYWAFMIHLFHLRTYHVLYSSAVSGTVWPNCWDATKPKKNQKMQRNWIKAFTIQFYPVLSYLSSSHQRNCTRTLATETVFFLLFIITRNEQLSFSFLFIYKTKLVCTTKKKTTEKKISKKRSLMYS